MELIILTGLAFCLVGLSGEARLTVRRLTKEEPGRNESTKGPLLLASEGPDLGSLEAKVRPMMEQKCQVKTNDEETVPPGTGHVRAKKTPKAGSHSHVDLTQAPTSSGKSPSTNNKKGLSRCKSHFLGSRGQEAKPISLKPEKGRRKEGKSESLPPATSQSRKSKTLPQEVTGSREEKRCRNLGGRDSKKVDLKSEEARKTIKAVPWRLQQKAGWGQNTSNLASNWKDSGLGRGDIPLLHQPIVFPSLSPPQDIMPSFPATCHLSEATISCGNVKMKVIPRLSDPSLKTLYLSENDISKISAETFNGVPNLEWLDLSKNKLDTQSLHPDVFKNLTRLKRINLDGNSLSAIPELPGSLQELKINDNVLRGLHRTSFRGLTKLLTLEAEGNQLNDGNIYPLAFQPLKSLMYLRLDCNHFRGIPQGLPASLQELHLDANQIEEVSERVLNKSWSLNLLVLSNNRIQEDRIDPRAWIDLPRVPLNSICDPRSSQDSNLISMHLENNLIDRRQIPPTAFSCIKTYQSVVLKPQQDEEEY
ncbi:extracellular matrix protein 2-like [Petaurus breviceps papuanus]|uniref:extracellular matrix protein 2-like n=1 Tax=Petaurus breviceps papuanus TaxID=3040969 RepID=UPI0036DB9CFB